MLKLVPFALKDAPALIEAVFPAQKISFEAQKERKSGAGQTMTALGSYWKGRKPLICSVYNNLIWFDIGLFHRRLWGCPPISETSPIDYVYHTIHYWKLRHVPHPNY